MNNSFTGSLVGSSAAWIANGCGRACHHVEEIDTEHIFGFVEGSDTGEKGELEADLESFKRNWKA